MAKKNEGKEFETDIEKSVKDCGERIFFTRVKDTFIPANLRTQVRVTKNPYDCLMFARQHLFTLELKSTKQKSISFDESIIKQHQIDNLTESDTYDGVISGFIMNFREPENKVFFIHINDFVEYKHVAENEIKDHKYKSKINKSSIPIAICEEIGIEIKGFKKRVRYHYHIKEFLTDAIRNHGQTFENKKVSEVI